MLLYTLFSYKEPFHGSDANAIQSVTVEKLTKLFDDSEIKSKTLKTLLLECCKRDPKERPTFRKIIDKYEKKLFPQILVELDLTESLIQEIWDKAAEHCKLPKNPREIEFQQFYEFLVKYFALNPEKKPEEVYYLKEALRLPFFYKLGQSDPKNMPRDNFGILARLFRFGKKKDETFIQRIVEVFKSDWFYGTVDRTEAQNKLEDLAKRKKR